jgi:peptidoglycan/xylan/chitin deacetylase (PgdA/CDA1 family)
VTLRPHERLRYVGPRDRPKLALPGGARVAVFLVVNVEHWLIDNPMPRQVLVAPTGAQLLPDLPNWAWHEYGMRVGFWRLFDALEARAIRPTLSINGSVCEAYPAVAGAAHDAGWEFMGHGFVQVPTHRVEDEPAMIASTVEAIRRFTGEAPAGWLGPGLTETLATPDHLAAAGIRYLADFVVDDRPCRLATAHGPILSMPYSVELNDIPVVMIQHRPMEELARRVGATADRLLAEAEGEGAKIMGVAVHPYITGAPHRIAAFEAMLDGLLAREGVTFMQGREIADWYITSDDDA